MPWSIFFRPPPPLYSTMYCRSLDARDLITVQITYLFWSLVNKTTFLFLLQSNGSIHIYKRDEIHLCNIFRLRQQGAGARRGPPGTLFRPLLEFVFKYYLFKPSPFLAFSPSSLGLWRKEGEDCSFHITYRRSRTGLGFEILLMFIA